MYYYNGGYPNGPMGYPVYQQNNNSSLWSIILIIFILFIIIGCGFNRNGNGYNCCQM